MDVLSIQEALKIMESGKPFAVRVVSYDRKRKSGGAIKFYSELVTTKTASEFHPKLEKQNTPASKAQNHHENFTRNFFQCINGVPTSCIKSLHIYGVLEVNSIKLAL